MTLRRIVVLFGPPGAGKGTQAKVVAEKTGLPHVSTGDIFRKNLKERTELGVLAQEYLKAGGLVPDDVTIRMVNSYLLADAFEPGVLLDGFPRTLPQAEAVKRLADQHGSKLVVVYIDVPDAVIMERLTGRVTCRLCGDIYHQMYNPPPIPGQCVHGKMCEFYQREDDTQAVVENRLRVYQEQTMPLLAYFEGQGVLVKVNGDGSIERVSEMILSALPVVA